MKVLLEGSLEALDLIRKMERTGELREIFGVAVALVSEAPRGQLVSAKSDVPMDTSVDSDRAVGMNKTELIELIARESDISKAAATRALAAIIDGVKSTLKEGGTVTLVGFGTFSIRKRAARSGVNPRTGAAIKIKGSKVPKFQPGKALKDKLN